MRRFLIISLAIMTAMSAVFSFAPGPAGVSAQTGPGQRRRGFSPDQERALREITPRLTEFEVDQDSVPSWMMGDLGPAPGEPRDAAVAAMRALDAAFRRTGQDDFEARQPEFVDELGQTHVRLRQRYRGLPVVGGGHLIVHLRGGRVTGVNGTFVADIGLDTAPGLSGETATAVARRGLPSTDVAPLSEPELVVFVTEERTPVLAWSQQVSFPGDDGMPEKELIFADARSGDLLARRTLIWTAKFRKVHDAKQTYNLPGTLSWQETSPPLVLLLLDQAEQGARAGTGATYDFYKNVFNRDSYDDAGSQLVSSVHVGVNYNNAYWDPVLKQMAYGDGDGVEFGPLSLGVDVTAHELTHGVTQATADLVYAKEPGALNEAISDIFGECAEAYGARALDWKIGDDVYTPNVPGDALRYMNNPTLDNYSADYYPDRLYPGSCSPTKFNDYCGVHGNSGIANLAFYLMVSGGSHPQGKTSINVPAVGLAKARKIWYRALTVYMEEDDTFNDARYKTIKAAADLYGGSCSDTVKAVRKAWSAVGVGNIIIIDPCIIPNLPL